MVADVGVAFQKRLGKQAEPHLLLALLDELAERRPGRDAAEREPLVRHAEVRQESVRHLPVAGGDAGNVRAVRIAEDLACDRVHERAADVGVAVAAKEAHRSLVGLTAEIVMRLVDGGVEDRHTYPGAAVSERRERLGGDGARRWLGACHLAHPPGERQEHRRPGVDREDLRDLRQALERRARGPDQEPARQHLLDLLGAASAQRLGRTGSGAEQKALRRVGRRERAGPGQRRQPQVGAQLVGRSEDAAGGDDPGQRRRGGGLRRDAG